MGKRLTARGVGWAVVWWGVGGCVGWVCGVGMQVLYAAAWLAGEFAVFLEDGQHQQAPPATHTPPARPSRVRRRLPVHCAAQHTAQQVPPAGARPLLRPWGRREGAGERGQTTPFPSTAEPRPFPPRPNHALSFYFPSTAEPNPQTLNPARCWRQVMKALLSPRVASLPEHVQSVYIHNAFQKLGRNQKYWLEASNVVVEGGWRAVLAVAKLDRGCWVRAITYTAHPDPPWTSMGPDILSFQKLGRNQKNWQEVLARGEKCSGRGRLEGCAGCCHTRQGLLGQSHHIYSPSRPSVDVHGS